MSTRFHLWLNAFTCEICWRMLFCCVLWPAAGHLLHSPVSLLWLVPVAALLALWEFSSLLQVFAWGVGPLRAVRQGLRTMGSLFAQGSWKCLICLLSLLPLLFAGTLPVMNLGMQSMVTGQALRGLTALSLLYLLTAVILAWPGLTFLPGALQYWKTGERRGTGKLNPLAAFVLALVLALFQAAGAFGLKTATDLLYTSSWLPRSLDWLTVPVLQVLIGSLPPLAATGMLCAGTLGLAHSIRKSHSSVFLAALTSVLVCLCVVWPAVSLADHRAQVHPVTVAHRGYARDATENTVESFQAAVQAGARVAELDVYQSRDGQLYVSHDQNLVRVTGTSLDVEQASAGEISRLKTDKGQRIPTLQEVLDYAKESGLHLVIEIKSTSRAEETAAKAAREIRETGISSQCAIAGFRHSVLAAARQVDPSLSTVLLLSFAISDVTSLADVDIYSVQADAITPEMIRQVHQAGKRIYAWTVNDRHRMDVLLAMGVDGITTDDAPASVAAIAAYEKRMQA
ncbi:glycerophosphodiester phosphodiesterase family protein [uncultured Faecalibaculum sp.]|uniref:glycerophosphodiester phosphodiesterase n=1 Tax=uncultured Faecalibaculum sp. TaxID=1729681 RepID=UPI0025EA6247|nr:glycerophosphodiester phosphodiesterase family protein [uncultured Faecalibaculum sp.]